MAFRSATIGFISILSALAPAGVPDAFAHHDEGYGEYRGYYSNAQPQWENPYYAPAYTRPIQRTQRINRRTSQNGNTANMPGFRCYYKGKDGSCMNYSYIHGPQWGQWNDAVYPPVVASPYGYDRNYNSRWDDEPCGYSSCRW